MTLTTEWAPYGSDAEFRGFAAWPARAVGPLPAVMVIQEAWGGYLPAVLAAARFLHEAHPTTRGQKLGAIGFCMGGALSAQLAGNDAELAAAVIFYGRSPPPDVAARIRCPVRGFYGALDPAVNQTVPTFAEVLKKNGVSFEATT